MTQKSSLALVKLAMWTMISFFSTACVTTKMSTTTQKPIQVIVEEGDTLNKIAAQFDTNWKSIAQLNRESLKKGLRVGQSLSLIPGPMADMKRDSATQQGLTNTQQSSPQNPSQLSQNQSEEDSEGVSLDDEEIEFKPRKKGLLYGGSRGKSGETSFIYPLPGRVTSKFGMRKRKFHKGIDIAANVGTPIRASAAGEVIFSGKRRGYGGTVVIDHGEYMTLYAHCSKLVAKVGDIVEQGDYIAKAGRSGNARGAHLHFEIRDANNKPVDPLSMLRAKPIAKKDSLPKGLHLVASRGR